MGRIGGAALLRVKFTTEGMHYWPLATQGRSYLAHLHRHLFHVEVFTEALDDDREIEFHDLRDASLKAFAELGSGRPLNFGPKSCETLSRLLAMALVTQFKREFLVSVMEDDECGASVLVSLEDMHTGAISDAAAK